MKEVEAYTSIEVNVDCPYCNEWLNILNVSVREVLGNELSCKDADVEIVCISCKKTFIVHEIIY